MKNLYITSRLLALAYEKFGFDIMPTCTSPRFRDGIMEYNGYYFMYFNTIDHSTHLVKISKQECWQHAPELMI